MQQVLIVVHLLIVLAMVGVILLQRSEGGGLGIGSTGGFLTSRGTSNVLTRATAFLAIGFFATSLVLSVLAGIERKPTSVFGAPGSQPAAGAPQLPLGGGGGAPDQPRQQPSGPQVPSSQ
jgi:preprotein translocase subunit SecG